MAKTPKKTQTHVVKLTVAQAVEAQRRGQPLVVSYGMGVDSTAMLVGLKRLGIRPDLILFADTGAEKRATYRYLPTIQAWLKKVGFPQVQVVRYQTTSRSRVDPRTGSSYQDLAGQCWATGHLPSLAYGGKTCSIKWKAQPQERYLKSWAPATDAWDRGQIVVKLIGYDAGPADSRRGAFCTNYEPKLYDWLYPLQEWGWDRDRCKREIAAEGLPVPKKSSCTFCPAMKPEELRELALEEPQALLAAIDLEDNARESGKLKGGILGLWRKGTKTRPATWRTFAEDEGLIELAHRRAAEIALEDLAGAGLETGGQLGRYHLPAPTAAPAVSRAA